MRLVITFLTLLAGAATLLIPVPGTWPGDWTGFHIPLAIAAAMMVVYLGAAWFFLSSLGAYKTNLRVAYTTISAGIALNAIGTVQLAVITAFDMLQSAWVQTGGVVLPFMLSGFLLYFGMRNFAKLVGAKTRLTKVRFVLPSVAAIGILAAFLPHAPSPAPEITEDISNAILLWVGLLDVAAAGIALRVKQHIGSHYTNAIAWMFIALIGSFIVVVLALVSALLVETPGDIGDTIVNILSVVVGFLYMQAGYVFCKAKDY